MSSPCGREDGPLRSCFPSLHTQEPSGAGWQMGLRFASLPLPGVADSTLSRKAWKQMFENCGLRAKCNPHPDSVTEVLLAHGNIRLNVRGCFGVTREGFSRVARKPKISAICPFRKELGAPALEGWPSVTLPTPCLRASPSTGPHAVTPHGRGCR